MFPVNIHTHPTERGVGWDQTKAIWIFSEVAHFSISCIIALPYLDNDFSKTVLKQELEADNKIEMNE